MFFMLFMPFLLSLSCIIHHSHCSPQCLFPPRALMPILFPFTPTVAQRFLSTTTQYMHFSFFTPSLFPWPTNTPVLFSLSPYHHIHHTRDSFPFTHTRFATLLLAAHYSSPSKSNILYPQHRDPNSTGIRIPVKSTNIREFCLQSYPSMTCKQPRNSRIARVAKTNSEIVGFMERPFWCWTLHCYVLPCRGIM